MKSPTVRSKFSDKRPKNRGQATSSEKLVANRIQLALKEAGRDQDYPWLARETGIPASTMYDALNRGISKSDQAIKIAASLGVSIDWLLTGQDATESPPALLAAQNVADDGQTVAEQLGLRMIPEVDIAYSMGGGSFTAEYADVRMVPFRSDWLDRISAGQPADFFLAGGIGDSMMPTILSGDDVLVNRADNVIKHHDLIWALGYGELGMIKRVRRLPSGMFQLNSDNATVTPIEATEDELFVVGRVAWVGRKM